MSVVVAIKEKGKVYIGADSQSTKGSSRITLKNANNYKIWKVRGGDNCLMGHVGIARDASVIRLMNNLIDEYAIYKDMIDYEYVVKSIVPDIINELKKYGYIKDEPYFDAMESKFLFAFKDKLYLINGDGNVIEIEDCVAIGSGEYEAIGSLLSTQKLSPEERIVMAIKASAAHDIYVDYPIILSDTETTEFTVITEKEENKFLKHSQEEKKKNEVL